MPKVFQGTPDADADPDPTNLRPSPFFHVPHTFNESTFALDLPQYMTDVNNTGITLQDGGDFMNLGMPGSKGDKASYLAELHLYYYNFSALCTACDCGIVNCDCPSYSQLFDRFLQGRGLGQARAQQSPDPSRP